MVNDSDEYGQTFLLRLSDSLRAETCPQAVGQRATQLLAQQLRADRVYLVSLNPQDDTVVVTHETSRQDLPPLQGTYHSSDFPAAIQEIFQHTIVYTDVRTDDRLTDLDRLSFAGLGAVGFMATSLRLGSQTMIWAAGAVSTQPRSWTESEVVLFEHALERTWAALERARTEDALRQSEAKYHSLFESADEGFHISELIYNEAGMAVDWRFLEVNQAFERQTGLQHAAGQLGSEIAPNTEAYWLNTYRQVVHTGQPIRLENYNEATGRWYSAYATRVGLAASRQFAVVFTDVTERKRYARQQDYLLTLSEALRSLADPVTIEETITRIAMRYFEADRCYYCRIENGNAIITRDARQSHLPSVAGTYPLSSFALLNRVVDTGQPFVVDDAATTPILDEEIRAICLQLHVISFVDVPVIKHGQAVGVLCVVQSTPRHWSQTEVQLAIDTAERTWAAVERAQAEEAQRASEKRFRLAIEATELGTWDWHLLTDEVYWNEQHFRLFGLQPQPNPIAPDVFFNHVHPDERPRVTALLQQTIAVRGIYDMEFRAVLADGSERWMSGYGRIMEEVAGQPVRMSGVMFDIDERRRAEDALKEADRRKDEFLAMLAHELRNPLSTIRSGLHILDLTIPSETALGASLAPTVEMMNRQSEHLVRMVDDLLDVSRISRGRIELKKGRVNLVELVRQAQQSMIALFEQQGKVLHMSLPDIPIELDGDATRLTQVVINLLTNGLRYTGDGGQVWLILIQQAGPPGGQEALLQVRDNGIGLAADQLSAIFELFVQVDNSLARSKGGLGLGLTLVKRLVELHGGRVEAQSAGIGQGSTFSVYLPTLLTPTESKSNSASMVTDPAIARRILVIDDNADAGLTLVMLLKLKGYDAHSRTSGQAGLQAAASLQPAAILLDIGMPGMDGYETLRRLRQQAWGQSVVVIALTGYGQQEDRRRTSEAGFNGHLVKPIDLAALTNLLTDLLDTDHLAR